MAQVLSESYHCCYKIYHCVPKMCYESKQTIVKTSSVTLYSFPSHLQPRLPIQALPLPLVRSSVIHSNHQFPFSVSSPSSSGAAVGFGPLVTVSKVEGASGMPVPAGAVESGHGESVEYGASPVGKGAEG